MGAASQVQGVGICSGGICVHTKEGALQARLSRCPGWGRVGSSLAGEGRTLTKSPGGPAGPGSPGGPEGPGSPNAPLGPGFPGGPGLP